MSFHLNGKEWIEKLEYLHPEGVLTFRYWQKIIKKLLTRL